MGNETLEIVYCDEHLVVINKPPGLLVHRSAIDRHETRFAMQLLRDQLNQRVYPVHRLDKPTSGLLVFALNSTVAAKLNTAFQERQVSKIYHAIVRGWPVADACIDYALQEQQDKMTDGRAQDNKPAQAAVTYYKKLAQIELPFAVGRYATSRYALLELQPRTGRKHQLRRHMHHIYHPIIGDTTHGEGRHNRFFREQFNVSRLLLAATQIKFRHPVTAESLKLSGRAGKDFELLAQNFGWPDV